jgi:4-amino-4-deoxy-L-arabinose transferase-like glycosyltransferase
MARTAITRTGDPLSRRDIVVILRIAFCLRAVIILSTVLTHAPSWYFGRGLEMGWLAQSLLDGLGLASPFGVPTGPTAFIAPGYPLLVAGVFRILGSYSVASSIALMSISMAANLLTIWLIMRLTAHLFNRTAARVAGVLWTFSLPLLFMPTIFWETSLSACILTALVCFGVEAKAQTNRTWLLVGAAAGLAGLINPALLPVLIAMLAWKAFDSTSQWALRSQRLLLATVALVAVFSPWPIRNARVFHAFIPMRTTVGFELWMGNRPGSDGFLNESIFPAVNPTELALYRQQGEIAYTAGKQQLAEQFIRDNPGRFVKLSAIRTLRFWSGNGNKGGSVLYGVYAMLTTLCGFTGLWLLIRRRSLRTAIPFLLVLALFPLPYCITHAEFRYRLVIDPLLTILTGGALVAAARFATRNQVEEHVRPDEAAPRFASATLDDASSRLDPAVTSGLL